jgi:IclR family transcriptional regulator, mhp operon transcriptional activator
MYDRPAIGRRSGAKQAPSEVLLRGLSVLSALNRHPVSSVEVIAEATLLPKATVVRVLNLLVSCRYVQRLPRRGGYMLGKRVVDLSIGYRSQDAVVETARPFLSTFTAAHKWPLVLATLDIDAMRIRAFTAQESPFAAVGDRDYVIQRRVAILPSAIGRAYVAFCPPEERATLLSLLRASSRPVDRPAKDLRYVERLLRGVEEAGYASSDPVVGDPARGVAIPIRHGESVLGTLAIRTLPRHLRKAGCPPILGALAVYG